MRRTAVNGRRISRKAGGPAHSGTRRSSVTIDNVRPSDPKSDVRLCTVPSPATHVHETERQVCPTCPSRRTSYRQHTSHGPSRSRRLPEVGRHKCSRRQCPTPDTKRDAVHVTMLPATQRRRSRRLLWTMQREATEFALRETTTDYTHTPPGGSNTLPNARRYH